MAGINRYGSITHGIGGGQASVDNVPFSQGGVGGWFDDTTVLFADGSSTRKRVMRRGREASAWLLSLYDVPSGQRQLAVTDPNDPRFGLSANTLMAVDGIWAAWLAGTGLYASTGYWNSAAGLLGVGPGRVLGYKPDYYGNGPSLAREVDGLEWTITPGHAADLQLLGDGRAIWQEGNQLRTCGLPAPLQVGKAWRPSAYFLAGHWWVSYWSDVQGVVLHPIDDLTGWVIVPITTDCWHTGRVIEGGILRFSLSSGEGEQPGQVQAYDMDWTRPAVDLSAPITEPPVIEPPPVVVEPPPVIEPPPVVEPPPTPTPEPEGGDMLAAYGSKIMPGFVPGTEVDNGNGTISVQKPNGKYLCVTPEGSVEERDTPGGVWESFKKGRGCLIAERDGEAKGPRVYVLSAAETDA